MTKVTKTTNPLHFEDLDPHKFEDVVRGILYDFRDWQSIEATGRKGADDGFDIRAWEKIKVVENESEENEDEDNQTGEHPMEGNLWMIQCKREKKITPKEVEKIIEDVDAKNPPYAYILAAACDFSKKTQDKFREIMLAKGVTEFYMWGKSYLEDMLYLPKNDHILFTAFGISLNTRRRLRKTEIRFALNNKNKVFRIWGDPNSHYLAHKPVLIRDFNDEKYPYEKGYPNFDKNYHWIECIPYKYDPMGLWIHVRNCYAYYDVNKKEFDFFEKIDLLNRQSDIRLGKETEEKRDFEEKTLDFWAHFPIKNQAKFFVDGFIYFKDMLLIDDKGDSWYDFPHIFVEFNKNGNRPFKWYRYTLETNTRKDYLEEDFKRIKFLPKELKPQKLGKLHSEKLDIPYRSIGIYEGKISQNGYIFDVNDKYNSVQKGDILTVANDDTTTSSFSLDNYLEVTNIYETTVKQFIAENGEHPYRGYILQQIKRDVKEEEKIKILEVRPIYKRNFEGKLST